MIDRVRSLGDEARKRGDAISAAVDYNRALAQAPDDPQLLRIVAHMSRAEAAARLLRRLLTAALLLLAIGGAAWLGVRGWAHVRRSSLAPTLPPSSAAAGAVPAPPPTPASASVASTAPVAPLRPVAPPIPLSLGRPDTAAPK